MRRLGYTRYVAQGGDVGAGVTDAMGRQAPEGLIGIHTNLLGAGVERADADGHDEERAALRSSPPSGSRKRLLRRDGHPPQTIGYALLDSPDRPGRLDVDHDTDAYYKIARAFVDGQPSGNLTRDHILDNITLYWLTGTGASAARSYWEAYGPDAPPRRRAAAAADDPVRLHDVPGEIWRTPRSWVEASYPNVIYFNEVDEADTSPRGRSPSSSAPSSGRTQVIAVGGTSGRCASCAPPTTSRPVVRRLGKRDRVAVGIGDLRVADAVEKVAPARKSGSLCHSQLSGQLRLRESRPKLAERCRFDLPRAFGRQTEAAPISLKLCAERPPSP
jgi:hypothetical protein